MSISDNMVASYIRELNKENAEFYNRNDLFENIDQFSSAIRLASNNLKRLRFYHCNLKGQCIKIICEALLESKLLIELVFANNNYEEIGSTYISYCIKSCNVKILYLSGYLGEVGVRYICQGIKSNQNISQLYLIDNNNNISTKQAKYVAEALKYNLNLKLLYLNENKIRDAGVKYISEGIKKHSKLNIIGFSNCSITDTGINYLRLSVSPNLNLMNLDLGRNYVTESGVKTMLKSFKSFKNSKDFDLVRLLRERYDASSHSSNPQNNTNYMSLCVNDKNKDNVKDLNITSSKRK